MSKVFIASFSIENYSDRYSKKPKISTFVSAFSTKKLAEDFIHVLEKRYNIPDMYSMVDLKIAEANIDDNRLYDIA